MPTNDTYRLIPTQEYDEPAPGEPGYYAPKPKKQAWFNSSWTSWDQWSRDQKGFIAHSNFNVTNMKGREIRVALFVYESGSNRAVYTGVQKYSTPNGQMTAQESAWPKYQNAQWKNFKLFVPYGVFLKKYLGRKLYYVVQVQDRRTGQSLGSSKRQYFNIN